MRTTIDIDDQLFLYAKQKALENHSSLKNVIEDALRELLSRSFMEHGVIQLETFQGGGGLKQGVDLDSNRSLNDIMDGL